MSVYDSQQFNDPCSEQMRQFFRDYLEDVSSLITKIKANIYQVVNINSGYNYTHQIRIQTDIASILSHCKRTFDDLRRIDSLLEGYVIGKSFRQLDFRASRSKSSYHNNISFNNLPIYRQSFAQDLCEDPQIINFTKNVNKSLKMLNSRKGQNNYTSNNKFSPNNNYQYQSIKKKTAQNQTSQHNSSQTNSDKKKKVYFQLDQRHHNTNPTQPIQSIQKLIKKTSNSKVEQITTIQTETNESVKKNSKMFQQVIKRNSECLSIIRYLKKEISRKKKK